MCCKISLISYDVFFCTSPMFQACVETCPCDRTHHMTKPAKIIKVILNFSEFASACKKSAQFIHSFIHSPCTRVVSTVSALNFWYHHKKDTISLLYSRDILYLKTCTLIGQHCVGPIWLENKLADLLILLLTKNMIEK